MLLPLSPFRLFFILDFKIAMKADLKQLFNEFMWECEFVRKARPETLKGYIHAFSLLQKIIPAISLDSLTPSTITYFFKVLQERKRIVGKGIVKIGIKKSTTATYWRKLNTFFEWLVKREYLNRNPFKTMAYPTPEYEDRKYLSREQIERIFAAIYNHSDSSLLVLKRNLVLFYILLFCGLRREEVIHLQLRDIDFERRTLTVRAATSKSAMSRLIPLHPTVSLYLKDYLKQRQRYTTQYLIVSSKQDDRLTYNGLKHLVNKLVQRSGVRFHLHQFRHTFAVNYLKESNNLAQLKQLLGHKSITMTITYLRCLPVDQLRGDIETMSIDKFI
jgi:integrase/recombinase XerD